MSGDEYVFAGSQRADGDTAWCRCRRRSTIRRALNQPFAFGWREGVAVACGAVSSYFSPKDALRRFPAWSVQLPASDAVALSGPEYSGGWTHETPPDTGSVPVKLTESGARYQPAALGARAGVAVTCGAVASYLTTTERGATLPARSRQAPLMVAVAESGPAYCSGGSQESSPEVASLPA